jgi:hypothetical protein
MTAESGVAVGICVLLFSGVIAGGVIVVLLRRGIAWKEVPGSRNRVTGLAINWFTLVVIAYMVVVALDGTFLLKGL